MRWLSNSSWLSQAAFYDEYSHVRFHVKSPVYQNISPGVRTGESAPSGRLVFCKRLPRLSSGFPFMTVWHRTVMAVYRLAGMLAYCQAVELPSGTAELVQSANRKKPDSA